MFRKSVHHDGHLCMSARLCVYITCDYWVWYGGNVLYAVCYVCVRSVYGVVVFLGAMYMLAMVMSLKYFVCIFRSCISVLMVCGVLMCVNVVSDLM